MKRYADDKSELYANSVRKDAWRAALLHEEMAEKSADRRRAAAKRWAIAVGVMLGLAGSYFTHFA
jgi:hypothetical protein